MSAAPAHLEVNGLTKRYGGLTAVKDMALTVRAGEIVGLIGPNGSGKSTVMKLIMGIERPDARARCRLNGVEVAGWPSHRVARMGAGIVFQRQRAHLHRQTVRENASSSRCCPTNSRSSSPTRRSTHMREAILERVGLGAVLDRRPATLPFADLRKMEIAKAIARDPRVLLIDEPFAGLTSTETAAFSDLISEMRRDGRHPDGRPQRQERGAPRPIPRALAMYVGEHIAEGTAEEVMRDETVRRVYLNGAITTASRPESSFRDAATPFLAVDKVSVHYGKAQALENVSIHVHAGEFVSVVGLNGAGKTTLFNAISGLVPYAGEIRREGSALRGRSAAAIARGGIVQCPEDRALFTDMTVRENLDLGGQHLPPAESAEQIAWLFELFPILREQQKQNAGTLSGGEQQMLTTARAMMMKPKLLILDEPTLGLAPVILEQLSKALEPLRQTTPITVLLGEQNVTFALPHADRVYVLQARPSSCGRKPIGPLRQPRPAAAICKRTASAYRIAAGTSVVACR